MVAITPGVTVSRAINSNIIYIASAREAVIISVHQKRCTLMDKMVAETTNTRVKIKYTRRRVHGTNPSPRRHRSSMTDR
jgi:hypothetical protein